MSTILLFDNDFVKSGLNSLDATQQGAAILGSSPIDRVLGSSQDGKILRPEGLLASQMNAGQQAALLKLISHYGGLVNEENAAVRMTEIQSTLPLKSC